MVSMVSDEALNRRSYHRLVLIGDVGDGSRQREHHVEIRHRQKLRRALGQPFLSGGALTLRAVPVAAGVIGDDGV
jgi:hypothetical protein